MGQTKHVVKKIYLETEGTPAEQFWPRENSPSEARENYQKTKFPDSITSYKIFFNGGRNENKRTTLNIN